MQEVFHHTVDLNTHKSVLLNDRLVIKSDTFTQRSAAGVQHIRTELKFFFSIIN